VAKTTKAQAAQHRPAERSREIAETVTRIIEDVTKRGDAAVREWSARLDRWERQSFRCDRAEPRNANHGYGTKRDSSKARSGVFMIGLLTSPGATGRTLCARAYDRARVGLS